MVNPLSFGDINLFKKVLAKFTTQDCLAQGLRGIPLKCKHQGDSLSSPRHQKGRSLR